MLRDPSAYCHEVVRTVRKTIVAIARDHGFTKSSAFFGVSSNPVYDAPQTSSTVNEVSTVSAIHEHGQELYAIHRRTHRWVLYAFPLLRSAIRTTKM